MHAKKRFETVSLEHIHEGLCGRQRSSSNVFVLPLSINEETRHACVLSAFVDGLWIWLRIMLDAYLVGNVLRETIHNSDWATGDRPDV